MIKIVKEGNINWHNATCPDCKTEFQYTESSTLRDYEMEKAIAATTAYPKYVNCPVCNYKVRL